VLDTNIIVRAFINLRSDSGRIIRCCQERGVVPLMSGPVLREYRDVLGDSKLLQRYRQLQRPDITVAIERLLYVSDMYRGIGVRFPYPRDPKDAPMIELAIAGAATHLISTDDDLLSLSAGRGEAARRFRRQLPHAHVITPELFVRRHAVELGLE
jgi:putative PIN family toxin of toxin-antitoxin system